MIIGFIGNFEVSFSTENERKKAFEELGHRIIPFQENRTDTNELLKWIDNLDMLMYSHTHGWGIPNLKDLFIDYKEHGVPTVSAHLDRWAWLEREKDIGQEATWFTEYIFMADASPEAVELYEKHDLNWHYLKPAVAKDQCYMANPLPEYSYDVVFIGSKGYHPEYPFRKELVEFLENTYGDKFGHFGGDGIEVVRERKLNQVLSGSKVVVGDTCFGGRPGYSSDRLTEMVGRGGFIITPDSETLGIPVETYQYPDLDDLKKKIDYWLDHDFEREAMRLVGHRHVKNHETYTHRAQEIIDKVFHE